MMPKSRIRLLARRITILDSLLVSPRAILTLTQLRSNKGMKRHINPLNSSLTMLRTVSSNMIPSTRTISKVATAMTRIRDMVNKGAIEGTDTALIFVVRIRTMHSNDPNRCDDVMTRWNSLN